MRLLLRLALPQRLTEVRIHRVVGLTLALRRGDPVLADLLALLLAEVLALKVVERLLGFGVQGEVTQT